MTLNVGQDDKAYKSNLAHEIGLDMRPTQALSSIF